MTNIAPSIPYPERAPQEYGKVLANPGRREGPRQAEEQLVQRDPAIRGAFAGGVATGLTGGTVERPRQQVERQVAGQANGRTPMASGVSANPTWDAVPGEALGAFADAMAYGDPGEATPYPYQQRPGARTGQTPLDGLARGERQNTQYAKAYAPPNGGRGRRNVADVTTEL